jgi:predicted nucleotidyltransferase
MPSRQFLDIKILWQPSIAHLSGSCLQDVETLKEKLECILPIFNTKLCAIYLRGSRVYGLNSPKSDLDLVILLDPIDLKDLLLLKSSLRLLLDLTIGQYYIDFVLYCLMNSEIIVSHNITPAINLAIKNYTSFDLIYNSCLYYGIELKKCEFQSSDEFYSTLTSVILLKILQDLDKFKLQPNQHLISNIIKNTIRLVSTYESKKNHIYLSIARIKDSFDYIMDHNQVLKDEVMTIHGHLSSHLDDKINCNVIISSINNILNFIMNNIDLTLINDYKRNY